MKMMHIIYKTLIVIIFSIFYSSCISNKKVLKEFPSTPLTFSKDSIDGVYANNPSYIFQKAERRTDHLTLWEKFDNCHSYFGPSLKVSENASVTLKCLENNRLKVVLTDSNRVKDSIVFKVKQYKDHLSISKVVLIPIPIVFFHFENIRLLLSTEAGDKLTVKYCRNQFVEVVLAGGVNEKSIFTFNKIGK